MSFFKEYSKDSGSTNKLNSTSASKSKSKSFASLFNPISTSNISGSSPRSSEVLYKSTPTSLKNSTQSSKKLLSVSPEVASSIAATAAATAAANSSLPNTAISKSGSSMIKYIVIIFILGFLLLNIMLYLEKPKNQSIIQMYSPLFNFFGINNNLLKQKNMQSKDNLKDKKNKNAISKLEETLNDKEITNNIDSTNKQDKTPQDKTPQDKTPQDKTNTLNNTIGKKYKPKKTPPTPNDTNDLTQKNKPKSKSGFCYIGEDRGFRSCIEVGKGDVCMSGDIFPTQDICINPNLRE